LRERYRGEDIEWGRHRGKKIEAKRLRDRNTLREKRDRDRREEIDRENREEATRSGKDTVGRR
jgi:hypothetical protein